MAAAISQEPQGYDKKHYLLEIHFKK